LKRLVNNVLTGRAVAKLLAGRWIRIGELAEILRLPPNVAYQQVVSFTQRNGHYTLLLKEEDKEACILIFSPEEWKNLLDYVGLLAKQ